jgi:hypothetical protein
VCEIFISGIASVLAPYGFEVTVAAKQLFELQQSTTLLSRHVNALIIGPLIRKLRVNSRSDAVYRAKHLGWL